MKARKGALGENKIIHQGRSQIYARRDEAAHKKIPVYLPAITPQHQWSRATVEFVSIATHGRNENVSIPQCGKQTHKSLSGDASILMAPAILTGESDLSTRI